MKFKYNLERIQNISDGKMTYLNLKEESETINLKESALLWWEKHNKESLIDKLLKRKNKNKYVGDKFWGFGESYLRFYKDNDEIMFVKEIPNNMATSDFCEARSFWEDIMLKLHETGYWLFDEG